MSSNYETWKQLKEEFLEPGFNELRFRLEKLQEDINREQNDLKMLMDYLGLTFRYEPARKIITSKVKSGD